MARTNFTPINEAFTSLINTIAQVHSDLLAKANAEREEALALYARMQETHADLVEFNAMVGNAAAALNEVDGVAADIGAKVYDVLDNGFDMVPACSYENFVGFCGGCGTEVTDEDACSLVDGEFYHTECAPAEDEDEVVADDEIVETVNAQQMTIDDIVKCERDDLPLHPKFSQKKSAIQF